MKTVQGCFDTPPDAYVEFAPSGAAVGWLIATNDGSQPFLVGPGECGAPRIYAAGLYSTSCATLYGIDASGTPHAGEQTCVTRATATPGVVLRPASADADGDIELDDPAPPRSEAVDAGCALARSAHVGTANARGSVGTLGLLGVLGAWRARSGRRRAHPG